MNEREPPTQSGFVTTRASRNTAVEAAERRST
jgi:hypothetical protein